MHLLTGLAAAAELADSTAVVIDVLRATTTIVQALDAGATRIVPCREIADARRLATQWGEAVLLAGERGGLPIEGFDLGNSPAEYQPSVVAGKTIVLTTTNGTRAMEVCRQAARVLIAAFSNLSAVCDALRTAPRVDLVCAGTDGQVTREDALLAGAIVEYLEQQSPQVWQRNDQADLAADAWRAAAGQLVSSALLADRLAASRGGRNLLDIGHQRDITLAAQLDTCELVPTLNPTQWVITSGQ